jgi:iron-sulfur cluster assembly protein
MQEGNADDHAESGVTSTAHPILVRYHRPVEITERPTDTLLTLTPVAAVKVRELMAEEPDADTLVLRVAIQGGGCSGFQYGLGFDAGPAEGDHELTLEGVPVVVDPFSAPYLQGATIDYLNGLQESGFKIDNPNAVSSCGCGHSFQVDEGEELPSGTHMGGCGSGCSH